MTDILRNDHAIQRALPNQYSELLQPACNGHALWAPRRTAEGGGALGDIGYIRDGSFWKEGNVYVDPPVSIQPLVVPTSGIYRGEHFHMPIMQSSSSSTVSFQVTGSATPATLPLTSVSVEPRFILKRKRLAFLAPPIPTVRDTVSVANETAFCDWLTDNRHRLDPGLVVLTHVVRSSGWIGGVVTGRNSNASVSVSGNASALATIGMDASIEYEVARLALTQGPRPTEWSERDAEYTLIVRFVRMRTRLQRQLHKIKLALSAGNSQQFSGTQISSVETALIPRELPIGDRGQGSAGSYGMGAAEDQTELASEQDEDDVDPVEEASYDEGDEGDRTPLDGILDMILDDNQDIDFVVADSRIVVDFIHAYPHLSHSELAVFDQEPTRIRPSFTTRSIPSRDGNATEIVACVTRLSLVDAVLVLPPNVDSPGTMNNDTSPDHWNTFANQQPTFSYNAGMQRNVLQQQPCAQNNYAYQQQQQPDLTSPLNSLFQRQPTQPLFTKEKRKGAKQPRKRQPRPDSSDDDSNGACTHCNKFKMKCEFPDDEDVCRRCKAGGHECIVAGRKPPPLHGKYRNLRAQKRQKDRTIRFLLKQIQATQGSLAAASTPSSSKTNPTISELGADDSDGPSQAILSRPDSRRLASDDQSRPNLLVNGIINFEEVDELFDIFFSRLNIFLPILDPILHTPASTFAQCPFLFTVVCATAARYYYKRPELHTIAMESARDAASRAVTQGFKSVELCQAYIILATYAGPAKRWEEDRNWLYTGLAIRIAADLDLHLTTSSVRTKPTNEIQERGILNRTRVWLICFNIDRSTSIQFGKMATLREDYIVRTSPDWYRGSEHNSKFDVHLCADTQLLRVMAHFIEEVFSDENSCSGFNKNVDWLELTDRYNAKFTLYEREQQDRFANDSDSSDPSCVYRTNLLPFLLGYWRLVVYSFGFQSAIDRGVTKGDVFFERCMAASTQVCTVLLERLAPTGYLRYAPDAHFLSAAFATAFLVKMLRLEYAHLIDAAERFRIVSLVTRMVDTLGSREISTDDKHTPRVYSRFLSSLLVRQQPAANDAVNRSGHTTPKMATTATPAQHSRRNNLHQVPQHGHMVPAAAMHNTSDLLQLVGTDAIMEPHDELTADETLMDMYALDNPTWWTNVMMPGYTNALQWNAPVNAASIPTNVGNVAPQQMPQQKPQQHTNDPSSAGSGLSNMRMRVDLASVLVP